MLPDIKFRNIIYFFVIGIFIQSCTLYQHPTVVDVELPGDKELTCAELKNSFAEASRYVQEAENTKGVTSDRAKRTLLLPFLMSGNYKNANEAIHAANMRRVHLIDLMRKKGCKNINKLEFKNHYKVF